MVRFMLPFGVKQDVLSVVIPVILKEELVLPIVTDVVLVQPLLPVTVTL